MQTTLFKSNEKTQVHEMHEQYIPTFIMVCNADGPIYEGGTCRWI